MVLLYGDIGAGKTTLTRFIAQALGIDTRQVSSPTFSLLNLYEGGAIRLAHIDLYRLGEGADVLQTGLADYLPFSGGVTIVEWSEYLSDNMMSELQSFNVLKIRIRWIDEDQRELSLEGSGDWGQKLRDMQLEPPS